MDVSGLLVSGLPDALSKRNIGIGSSASPLPLQVHDGSYTPTSQFVKDPESLCSTISWRDEEERIIWVYRMQVEWQGIPML